MGWGFWRERGDVSGRGSGLFHMLLTTQDPGVPGTATVERHGNQTGRRRVSVATSEYKVLQTCDSRYK